MVIKYCLPATTSQQIVQLALGWAAEAFLLRLIIPENAVMLLVIMLFAGIIGGVVTGLTIAVIQPLFKGKVFNFTAYWVVAHIVIAAMFLLDDSVGMSIPVHIVWASFVNALGGIVGALLTANELR